MRKLHPLTFQVIQDLQLPFCPPLAADRRFRSHARPPPSVAFGVCSLRPSTAERNDE